MRMVIPREKQKYFAAAFSLIGKIEMAGFVALIVGGAIRDLVMGVPVKDIDLVTSMPISELAAMFRIYDIGRNKSFGIVSIPWQGYTFEVARFRGVTHFDEHGLPKEMEPATDFIEDASRRDLTMNAMAMDAKGKIFDLFGGRADIKAKIVRCVGSAEERMAEDPLRALRTVRFAARFGFAIADETARASCKIGPGLAHVAIERISEELLKMASLSGPSFASAVRLMDELCLLKHVLPEIEMLHGLTHDSRYHPEGDVFDHTLAALTANINHDSTVNLAILLHDVGKVSALGIHDGRPIYYGHEHVGAKVIRVIANRLKLGRDLTEALIFTTKHHMQALYLKKMKMSKSTRLVTDRRWPVLKQVARCDLAARGDEAALAAIDLMFTEVETYVALRPPGPVLTGRRVMALTGLPPGPEIGRIIKEVTAWASDNGIREAVLIDKQVVEFAALFRINGL